MADSTKTINIVAAKKQIWQVLARLQVVDETRTSNDIIMNDANTYDVRPVLKSSLKSSQGLLDLSKQLASNDFSEVWLEETLGEAPDGSRMMLNPKTKQVVLEDAPKMKDVVSKFFMDPNVNILIGAENKILYQNSKFLIQTHGTTAGQAILLEQLLDALKPRDLKSPLAPSILNLPENTNENTTQYSALLSNFSIESVLSFAIPQFIIYQLQNVSTDAFFQQCNPMLQKSIITMLLNLTGGFYKLLMENESKIPPNILRLIQFTNVVNPEYEVMMKTVTVAPTAENDPDVLMLKNQNKKPTKRGKMRQIICKDTPKCNNKAIIQTNVAQMHKECLSQLVADCEGQFGPMIAVTQRQFDTPEAAIKYGRQIINKVWRSNQITHDMVHAIPLGQFCDISKVSPIAPTTDQWKELERRSAVKPIDALCVNLLKLYKNIVPQHNVCASIFAIMAPLQELATQFMNNAKLIPLAKTHSMLKSESIKTIIMSSAKLVHRYFHYDAYSKTWLEFLITDVLDKEIPTYNMISQDAESGDTAAEIRPVLEHMKSPEQLRLLNNDLHNLLQALQLYFNEEPYASESHITSQESINLGGALLTEYHSKMAKLLTATTDSHALNYIMSSLFPNNISLERVESALLLIKHILGEKDVRWFRQFIARFMIKYRQMQPENTLKVWHEIEQLCAHSARAVSTPDTILSTFTPAERIKAHEKNLAFNAGALQLMRLLGFGAHHTTMMVSNYWLNGAYHEFANTGAILYQVARKLNSGIMARCQSITTDVITDVTRALLFNAAKVYQLTSAETLDKCMDEKILPHPFIDYIYVILSDAVLSITDSVHRAVIGLDVEPDINFKYKPSQAVLEILAVMGLLDDKDQGHFAADLQKLASGYANAIEPATYKGHIERASTLLSNNLMRLTMHTNAPDENDSDSTAPQNEPSIAIMRVIQQARDRLKILNDCGASADNTEPSS